MIRIILSGCNGAMGGVISQRAVERGDCVVVAGIDVNVDMSSGYTVFSSPEQCAVEADVLLDFSHPSALEGLLVCAVDRKLPIVVATTGHDEIQLSAMKKAAESVPVFHSANMSLGISLISELAKTAARVLGGQFDIEILEKHHNRKLDAPSGTALMLANEISSVLPQEPQYVYDRHSRRSSRNKNEIGLHAIRGGTIVGEHEILFAGKDEVISLTHIASSREVFATGALSAAMFLQGKPAGLYSMRDMISG